MNDNPEPNGAAPDMPEDWLRLSQYFDEYVVTAKLFDTYKAFLHHLDPVLAELEERGAASRIGRLICVNRHTFWREFRAAHARAARSRAAADASAPTAH